MAVAAITLIGFTTFVSLQAIKDLQAEVDLLEDEMTKMSSKMHKLEHDLAKKDSILKG